MPVKVRINGLQKSFGDLAVLDSVSFDVNEGEICCLIGPSGAGKSTTFNLLAGLERPTAGEILLDGRPISPDVTIGYMFQDLRLLPWRTVLQNAAFGLKARGIPKAEREKIAARTLDIVGLGEFLHAYPHQLSGGMQQRVAMARAFAVDPEILLMDEPFKSVDAQLRLYFLDLLIKLWRETGKTILFITHDTVEAARLGHSVVVYSRRPVTVKTILRLGRPPDERKITDRDVIELDHKLLMLLQEEGAGQMAFDWIRGEDNEVREVLQGLRSANKAER